MTTLTPRTPRTFYSAHLQKIHDKKSQENGPSNRGDVSARIKEKYNIDIDKGIVHDTEESFERVGAEGYFKQMGENYRIKYLHLQREYIELEESTRAELES